MHGCHCGKISPIKLRLLLHSKQISRKLLTSSLAASTVSASFKTTKSYYRCQKNVTQHSLNEYSKFYSFPKQDINRLRNAIPTPFQDVSDTINETTLLLRKPSLEILEELQQADLSTAPKFILYGGTGGGKSLSLLHVLHYCLQKDWIVLHIPNAVRIIDSQGMTQVQESQWNTSRVDQPEEATLWLKQFRTMNPNVLTELKTTQSYKWGKREVTEKDRPLLEVLEQGIGRSLFSTDAVGVILKEIQRNESLKILYAVDAFNGFFGITRHKLYDKTVETDQLALLHHFKTLLRPESSIKNGAYLFALSQSIQYMNQKRDPSLISMLGEEVLLSLGEYKGIEVANYTENEFLNILNFYNDKGWLSRELSDTLVNELQFLTNRNPKMVREFINSL